MKIPPHSAEAEAAVLAAAMLDGDAVAVAVDKLKAEDFYDARNRSIFRAVLRLFSTDKLVDMVMIHECLANEIQPEPPVTRDYLVQLTGDFTSVGHVEEHIKIVKEHAQRRSLIILAERIVDKAHGGEPVESLVGELDTESSKIIAGTNNHGPRHISELTQERLVFYNDVLECRIKPTDIKTGFVDLDEMTNGLHKGELILIAGRPSMGKSSLAADIICNAAEHGSRVLFISLEMNATMIVTRAIARTAELVAHWLVPDKHYYIRENRDAIASAVSKLNKMPIYIDDSASTFPQIKARAGQMLRRTGLDLLVVDYIGLLLPEHKYESRNIFVSELSRQFKNLARELNIPVVVLSQLSRMPEHRPDKTPQLADLRDSGSLEQDSDLVIMIHRPDSYMADEETLDRLTSESEIYIRKNRNGPTGLVKLVFMKPTMRFRNYTSNLDGEETK